MYKVMMIIEGVAYPFGTYEDRDKANDIAIEIREMRRVETYIEEIE